MRISAGSRIEQKWTKGAEKAIPSLYLFYPFRRRHDIIEPQQERPEGAAANKKRELGKHMDREAFLTLFDEAEDIDLYRKLYFCCPAAFEEPVASWEEFCTRFRELDGEGDRELPDAPPTPIAALFTEEEYFSRETWGEVNVITNARYCPAFLHKLEFIKIIYVFRGSCRFYIDGKWLRMTEGNACIVAPEVEQTVFSCADEDIVLNLLIRRSTFAESFWDLLETKDGGVIADFFWKMLYHKPGGEVLLFSSRPDVLLEESVMELYEEALLQPVKSRLVMKSMMMSIFAYILRWDEKDVVRLKKKGDKGEYLLAKYLLYMKANLESVSLASLAREFYVSEGYLSRYFHRETGSTFSHLLMEMKMKRAAELLLKTECSIEKIVALIGYTDQSNFFRKFKAIYGMTPLVYRKKQGQADFMRVL